MKPSPRASLPSLVACVVCAWLGVTLHGQVIVNWTGGNLPGGGSTIGALDTLNITVSVDHDFNAVAVTNHGTVNWSAGRLRSGNSGSFTNNGLFVDSATDVVNNAFGGAALTLVNSAGATYRKTGGQSTFQVPFVNSGTIDLIAGTLILDGGGTFNHGSVQTGTGLLRFTGGTLTANGTSTFSSFELAGGTVTGNHTFNGALTWAAGNFNSGSSTTTIGGTLSIATAADHDFNAHAFVNTGTVEWLAGAGRIRSGNGGTFLNQGIFRDAASGVANNDYGGAAAQFTNAAGGLYQKTAAGTTHFGLPFINSGVVEVQAGTLSLNAGGTFHDGAQFTGAGQTLLAGGTFTLNNAITSANLTLDGGVVTGNHTLHGVFGWTSGNFNTSSSTTTIAGTLKIGGTADHDFNTHAFVNNGTVEWLAGAGRIRSGNGGTFLNQGTFLDAAASVFNSEYGGVAAQFNNAAGALYRKTGSGQTTFSVPLTNAGTVEVQAGVLSLNAGGTFNHGAQFTGAGQTLLDAGTFTLNGTITSANLSLSGGVITGNHTLAGTFGWTTGNFNTSSSTTTISGTFQIAGAGDHDFNTHAFVNQGTVDWLAGAGRIRSGNGGTFLNQGTFHDAAASVFNSEYGGTAAQFINAAGGLYRKTGPGQSTFSLPFVNSGTVDVQAGTLALTGGGTFNHGAMFTGAGPVLLSGGTFTLNGLITSSNLNLSGGTWTGSPSLAGTVTWNSGSLNNSSTTTIAADGTLNIATAADHDFNTHDFVNNGTVNWTGGRLRSGNGGSFLNAGNFYDSASSAVNNDFGGTASTFTNNNTYHKTAAGTTTFLVPFTNNNGAIFVTAGTLRFSSTFTQTAGTLSVANGASLSFDNNLNLAAGFLHGTGSVVGSVNSAGWVSAGAADGIGDLDIFGNLALGSMSVFFTDIGGTGQGTTYDYVDVTGSTSLGGSLLGIGLRNGFVALPGQTFTVLRSSSVSGTFFNVANGQYLVTSDGFGAFRVNYGGGSAFATNSVVLSNFVAVPEPSTNLLIGLGAALLALARRRRK